MMKSKLAGSFVQVLVALWAGCSSHESIGAPLLHGDEGTDASIDLTSPPKPSVSPFLVIDQFGYQPLARKIAIIRDPEIGFDSGQSFVPGRTYALVNSRTRENVVIGTVMPWNDATVDASSGDITYRFDFSSVAQPGEYYVHDVERGVRSHEFRIGGDVYRDVLKHAVRTFFYQRAGFEKQAQYAGAAWADGASHLKLGQDKNARLYSRQNDPLTERDLSGGWYDAGDYNKYTSWAARYLIELLKAYQESPTAFSDDYGIPESGNGTPDIVDEVKWGMDWLIRMQEMDGSVLSIVGLSYASPPSSAQGPSLYGPASTSATLSAAAAFALGSKIFSSQGQVRYAENLLARSKKAFAWAIANPNITFKNNDRASGTQGLGAGQQETDDYGRLHSKIEAAVYLFEATQDSSYRAIVDDNYYKLYLIQWHYASPFEATEQDTLLYYTKVLGATESVVGIIRRVFKAAMESGENLSAIIGDKDPYLAYIKEYTWGSNKTKASQGNTIYQMITYDLHSIASRNFKDAALGYVNYIHGVNPLGLVYLSNMPGAKNSVKEFYHSWFTDGSKAWDRVGASTYGPPPGFLVGGPNPKYNWDSCCPRSCGNTRNNAICNSEDLSPPREQPDQKAYKEFNTGWPLNSWEVTENSNSYQVAYIRLLSKFVGLLSGE
jgi:hypothetical protein